MASPKISPKMQKRIPIVSSLCPSIPRNVTCERSGNFRPASPLGFSWAEADAALSKVSRAPAAPAFANRLPSEQTPASQVRISDPPSKSCNPVKVPSCDLLPAHHFALYFLLRALMEGLTGYGTGCHFKKGWKCLALNRH